MIALLTEKSICGACLKMFSVKFVRFYRKLINFVDKF